MKNMKFVRPTDELVRSIADNMRQSDIDEVMAASGTNPYDTIINSFAVSESSVVVTHNGQPLFVYGFSKPNILSSSAIIWMLGVNDAYKYGKELMYYTPKVFDEMFLKCDLLYNYVHIKNTVSIAWLKRLGFTFDEPITYGVANEKFHKFYKSRN